MSERLPPAVAIFFSEPMRRKIMPRLGARVAAIRYDPATTIKSAFVEELAQIMAAAAGRLRPHIAPALSVVLVADPAQQAPGGQIVDLIKQACPPDITIGAQWIGVHRAGDNWPGEGVAFLLSTIWRGGLIQGGALDRAYTALILSVLATELSRVSPADFDCFARLRFHASGKRYQVAVDSTDLPDFARLAEAALRQASLAHYFPEISVTAREAALRAPQSNLGATGSKATLEATLAEPLLCAAIAESATIAQAAALLGDWTHNASATVAELLTDLQIALIHWAAETANVKPANPQLANALFSQSDFPLLHELKSSRASSKAFEAQADKLQTHLRTQKRTDLDREYYELLPNDLNADQRLRIANELANSAATRLTVTRHFPSELIADTREEILDLRDLSTVLYSLELPPT